MRFMISFSPNQTEAPFMAMNGSGEAAKFKAGGAQFPTPSAYLERTWRTEVNEQVMDCGSGPQ
jgi:hypothetical protein